MITRIVLIAVQVLVLPIWPGLCTCPRAIRNEPAVAAACDCGCCGGCCSPDRKPANAPKSPCKAPGCPADQTLVRADQGVPTVPMAVPVPAETTMERPAVGNHSLRSGQFDSTSSVPMHIFLACSVLLI